MALNWNVENIKDYKAVCWIGEEGDFFRHAIPAVALAEIEADEEEDEEETESASDDVEDEDGDSVTHAGYRRRALAAVSEQDWPSWEIG